MEDFFLFFNEKTYSYQIVNVKSFDETLALENSRHGFANSILTFYISHADTCVG